LLAIGDCITDTSSSVIVGGQELERLDASPRLVLMCTKVLEMEYWTSRPRGFPNKVIFVLVGGEKSF
jgi:hypothetical protein